MKLKELKKIIIEQNLDDYFDFYIGDLLEDEYSLSLKKVKKNNFCVRKIGERGLKRDFENLSEEEACDMCLKYLLYKKSKHNDIIDTI